MKPIRVFVSHSSEDRGMAVDLEKAMRELRMRPFLAHRDIEVGKSWREAIRKEIAKCDMLVALVTPNFRESEYTDQEVGAAWVLEKSILAVLAGKAEPTGFITDLQGARYDRNHPPNTAGEIMRFALSEIHGEERVVDMLTEMLAKSESPQEAEYLATILITEQIKHGLTVEQYKSIKSARRSNAHVDKSFRAIGYLDIILPVVREAGITS